MKPLTPKSELKGELLLLLTAVIWGLSFVSQREGMEEIGPFSFNALRFLLGGLALVGPAILFRRSARARGAQAAPIGDSVRAGAIASLFLFCGASFQQAGIVSTTAGNAGFLTGIYVVLVPVFGLFLGKRSSPFVWIGAVLALAGLYLLSLKADPGMGKGNLLVLAGAPFWAAHILVLDRFSARVDGLVFSITQFLCCALLSAVPALALEGTRAAEIAAVALPLSYSAFLAIGLGYTLQIFGQRSAHPGRASIILCFESPFAALSGILFLGEPFTPKIACGAGLVLSGMLLSQLEAGRTVPAAAPARKEPPRADT